MPCTERTVQGILVTTTNDMNNNEQQLLTDLHRTTMRPEYLIVMDMILTKRPTKQRRLDAYHLLASPHNGLTDEQALGFMGRIRI